MNSTRRLFTRGQMQFSNTVKAAIATALMLIFYINSWAGTTLEQPPISGSEMFVTAQSGLHMRTSPDVHANSIKVIYLGELVQVLEQPDTTIKTQVDWVTGQWLLIEHEGDQGYIFDGFLSQLSVPTYEWEKCQLDLDMIYPLEQWAEVNHVLLQSDTVEGKHLTKVSDKYENGNRLVKINSGDIYKIELYLTNARIMDAYHLLQNMLDDKIRVRTFHNQSIFIAGRETSDLERIKVKLDNPVDIRKLGDGTIKISIHSQEYPCQL